MAGRREVIPDIHGKVSGTVVFDSSGGRQAE
jgi:hypothetical protein